MVSMQVGLAIALFISASATADYPASFLLKGRPDPSHTVSAYVSADAGGALETKDRDGTVFRLRIPPNALIFDTSVSLTPIEASGLPGESAHIGVDISPAGTQLLNFATLEILPASGGHKHAYWLETTGDALSLQARPGFPTLAGRAMLLSHFSGGTMVSGGAQVSNALQNGAFDGTLSWFEWQRNVIRQELELGRIDKTTYDTKANIIEERSKAINEQAFQNVMAEAKVETAVAIERAKAHAKDGDLKNVDAFLDDVNVAMNNMRKNEIFGYKSKGWEELVDLVDKYFQALYANCENTPLGATRFYRLERMRLLLGAPDIEIDVDRCLNGAKFYRISADYTFKYKKTPVQSRYLDNIKKHFDLSVRVAYRAPEPTIEAAVVGFSDQMSTYENHFESPTYFGEGCQGTQTPVGRYEVFDYQLKSDVQAFYNPGVQFPPGVPVPPGFPVTPPSGSVQILSHGETHALGWNFTTEGPSCAMSNIAPRDADTALSFVFDPTKIEKKGAKLIESHQSEDESTLSGWIYTIERVN